MRPDGLPSCTHVNDNGDACSAQAEHRIFTPARDGSHFACAGHVDDMARELGAWAVAPLE